MIMSERVRARPRNMRHSTPREGKVKEREERKRGKRERKKEREKERVRVRARDMRHSGKGRIYG